MREGAVMTVCGLPGSFKSWVILDAAICTANGLGSFLGQPIRNGPVLYIAADDGADMVIDRLRMVAQFRLGSTHYDLIDVVDRGELNFSDTSTSGLPGAAYLLSNTIVSMYEDYGQYPAIVVVDTAAMAGAPTDDFGHSYPARLGWLKRLAAECHCCMVLIEHVSRHGDESVDVRSRAWGSIQKAGYYEAVWAMDKQGGLVSLDASDKRSAKLFELYLRFSEEEGVYTMEYSEEKYNVVKEGIYTLLASEVLDVATVADRLALEYQTTRRKVSELVEEGRIVVVEKASGRRPAKYGLDSTVLLT